MAARWPAGPEPMTIKSYCCITSSSSLRPREAAKSFSCSNSFLVRRRFAAAQFDRSLQRARKLVGNRLIAVLQVNAVVSVLRAVVAFCLAACGMPVGRCETDVPDFHVEVDIRFLPQLNFHVLRIEIGERHGEPISTITPFKFATLEAYEFDINRRRAQDRRRAARRVHRGELVSELGGKISFDPIYGLCQSRRAVRLGRFRRRGRLHARRYRPDRLGVALCGLLRRGLRLFFVHLCCWPWRWCWFSFGLRRHALLVLKHALTDACEFDELTVWILLDVSCELCRVAIEELQRQHKADGQALKLAQMYKSHVVAQAASC